LFHHSAFLAGQQVAGTGELKAVQGKFVAITNKSGHYKLEAKKLSRYCTTSKLPGVSIYMT
jgi:hypothetical protein